MWTSRIIQTLRLFYQIYNAETVCWDREWLRVQLREKSVMPDSVKGHNPGESPLALQILFSVMWYECHDCKATFLFGFRGAGDLNQGVIWFWSSGLWPFVIFAKASKDIQSHNKSPSPHKMKRYVGDCNRISMTCQIIPVLSFNYLDDILPAHLGS